MLVVGFITGLMGGGYGEFFGGVLWCSGQLIPLLLSWVYKRFYGADDWYKRETFFVV